MMVGDEKLDESWSRLRHSCLGSRNFHRCTHWNAPHSEGPAGHPLAQTLMPRPSPHAVRKGTVSTCWRVTCKNSFLGQLERLHCSSCDGTNKSFFPAAECRMHMSGGNGQSGSRPFPNFFISPNFPNHDPNSPTRPTHGDEPVALANFENPSTPAPTLRESRWNQILHPRRAFRD